MMEGLSAENKAQKERIAELEQQVGLLTEAIRLAQRKRFGASFADPRSRYGDSYSTPVAGPACTR